MPAALPMPDRVDPDALVGRRLGRRQRVGLTRCSRRRSAGRSTAGACVPAGTGVGVGGRRGRRGCCSSCRVRAGCSATAMALSEARMPWPTEVPFWGVRRSIAASTVAWSLVGCWTETPESLKATTPIDDARAAARSTKSLAAALAAAIRVGCRSVAAMLPETSKARMTVPSCARQVDDGLRSGQRDDHDGEPDEEQRRPAMRAGAAAPRPARDRLARCPGPPYARRPPPAPTLAAPVQPARPSGTRSRATGASAAR